MSPPRAINIGPYSFPIRAVYTDALTDIGAAEREVLDTARAERIRKKGYKVLEKLRAKSGRRTLSEGELRHLTTTIAEFDREMGLERMPDSRGTITERPSRLATEAAPTEPDFIAGEFDAEVGRLCRLRIEAEETARGIVLTPEQRDAAVAALREDPLIRDAARTRVDAALSERSKMLGELF